MTYDQIRKDQAIAEYISRADDTLRVLGFTEHSFAHVTKVANTCEYILSTLGADERDIELAKIAAYMHDIGNAINRSQHAEYGAILANDILKNTDMFQILLHVA